MTEAIYSLMLSLDSGPTLLAYLGPGLGTGVIAVILGFLASIFLALFAVLWYPFKRLVRKRKTPPDNQEVDQA